ncbi:MAG: 3-deoxy-7-phosphoheptulonate synthase [Coxiellaceae bacterium]|nr:3-deoxy-7-phosphoheptulonate synthase [Coxiellaceae bacterium]
MKKQWSPSSWRQYENFQPIQYSEMALLELQVVLKQLAEYQGLISISSIQALNSRLQQIYAGDGFILQGGDCAECFLDISSHHVSAQLQLLTDLSDYLSEQLGCDVLPVGRIAGQFAKPRSELLERVNEAAIPRYRGDMINDAAPSATARQLDPMRLLTAYDMATRCLRLIQDSHWPSLITSHEALHLDFEQALTRQADDGHYYNVSTHFPWIGMRTAQPDSAHIEYASGIANPVAIKVGPTLTDRVLQDMIVRLNPDKIPGKLSLIYRLGQSRIAERLPKLIDAALATEVPVLWLCDPMHGNTITTATGVKTRHCAEMMDELTQALDIHQRKNCRLHGVHLEMTHKSVTECIGGGAVMEEHHLDRAYDSPVDPRLNPEQSKLLVSHLCECDLSSRTLACHPGQPAKLA